MKQKAIHIQKTRTIIIAVIMNLSTLISTPSQAIENPLQHQIISKSRSTLPAPIYEHVIPKELGEVAGIWGYAFRILGEGLIAEGVVEVMLWAVHADCIFLCETTEQQKRIREIRLSQYQAIDRLDGKEDGLYYGVLVGFTDQWQNRDLLYEQEIINSSQHIQHIQDSTVSTDPPRSDSP